AGRPHAPLALRLAVLNRHGLHPRDRQASELDQSPAELRDQPDLACGTEVDGDRGQWTDTVGGDDPAEAVLVIADPVAHREHEIDVIAFDARAARRGPAIPHARAWLRPAFGPVAFPVIVAAPTSTAHPTGTLGLQSFPVDQ